MNDYDDYSAGYRDGSNDASVASQYLIEKLTAERDTYKTAFYKIMTLQAEALLLEPQKPVIIQTSGPQCKKCGAFTTYARVESHGLCMKCELEAK